MIERELEKEYKALLTKEQFEDLKDYFAQFTEVLKPYIQTNYYFDIENFGLIEKGTTIRIRHKENTWELQIKIPKVHVTGYFEQQELRQSLSVSEAKQYIQEGLPIDHPLLKEVWNEKKIGFGINPVNRLKVVGSLQTKRHDFKFYTDIISLDESTYFDITDYELEWETTNHKFVQYELNKLNITPEAVGKITRFLQALREKK
ncbi:CYTH domain-containing protein [Tepidibacillus sp. LV47]|uniref:CYTH domain-containing protein n=1 Tax=Tepidibacillus sp. LV47 TaxID=3398228 RepID=UPI003AABC2DF